MTLTKRNHHRWHLVTVAVLAALSLATLPVSAQQVADVTVRITDTTATIQKHLDLLRSPSKATRVAAFTEMVKSRNPALVDVAIETAMTSDDPTLQALALRAGFLQVRSIVAKLTPAPQSGTQSQAVIQACGDAVQYQVENYAYETGAFEVRGQDHVGVGQVNGGVVSLTIEYGCSLTATLQSDRTLAGIVSAPYKKGSLPAKMTFR